MIKLLKLSSLALFISLMIWFCEKKTEGFSINRITSHFKVGPSCAPVADLDGPFNQTFRYLGKGGQCFVFSSADQKYVIKFFRNHTIGHLLWLKELPWPSSFKQKHFKKIDRSEQKLLNTFHSYQIAFEELKEESGLIFLHLTKTDHLKSKIILIDPIGIKHVLNADDYEFIIQKKTEPFIFYLKKLMKDHQIAQVAMALKEVLNLIEYRFQKGIIDDDPHLYDNIGFLEGKPLFIDTGRFKKDLNNTIPQCTSRLKKWLEIEYPVLIPHYDNILAEIQTHD